MKKIYCSPRIRVIEPMGNLLAGVPTDSVGESSTLNSRRSNSFEEDEEEEITKSVWFDD